MPSSTHIVGAVAAALMIMTSVAWAQTPQTTQTAPQPSAAPGQAPGTAPQALEGQVVAIDPARGTMTVRATDGTTHEFRGSAETLREYKVGDQISLSLRAPAGR